MTSTPAQRNTEIWSTRLQRELLALTSDNAPDDTKEAVQTVLPPFITVKGHKLEIENGNCAVSFLVDLPPAKKSTQQDAADESAEAKEDGAAATTKTEEMDPIIIQLDTSLQKHEDGTIDPIAIAYPFLKPVAVLKSGSARLSEGSTIKDGDFVDIEMDWTPSLHLTDAILNIGLKIKECISQGEPFHPAVSKSKQPPMDDMVNKAKKFGSSLAGGLRGLAGKSGPGQVGESGKKDKRKGLRLGRKKKDDKKNKDKTKQQQQKQKANPNEIRIGDEINMLEAPWVDCQGVYSCKAIRRPAFVEDAMSVAAQTTEGEQVANAGLTGAGAMFRTFTQSARSVLEESFLMITETHIIEMRSNKLNLSTGMITFAIPIEMLAKLKFRRQESISLFFKPAPDDPLIYMCPDSADAVHQIQSVLKRHGVKGKHTNAATHRAINQALHLVQEIQTKELALKHDPSVERVNEIMDLYRQAAERFEVAGDVRHEEVVTHMRKFLALPLTVSILDGSYQKPVGDEQVGKAGEGVVLERSDETVAEEDTPATSAGAAAAAAPEKVRSNSDDRQFENNMDSILKEAEADLANMKMEDDPELDAILETSGVNTSSDVDDDLLADDAIADFENMLKEADDELAELMAS
eukprot:CAMPEP_0119546074 /NCGR_PEP_ID=MMETSP1352-20130426/631_1 /TAXON_ID=265584 /ORGANISM="Stauroneis constricta, Strain CCMP1120" /LENGTH=633 /DNA_ID=CAMNT_0007590731 /DNA_START=226 /DNA_END=2127 /DNA_ORIENTATION=+